MFLRIEEYVPSYDQSNRAASTVIVALVAITKIVPIKRKQRDRLTERENCIIYLTDNKQVEVPYSLEEMNTKLNEAMRGR